MHGCLSGFIDDMILQLEEDCFPYSTNEPYCGVPLILRSRLILRNNFQDLYMTLYKTVRSLKRNVENYFIILLHLP